MKIKLAAAAGAALAVIGIIVAIYAQDQPGSGLAGKTFSEGNFTVTIVEDSERRLLANVQNNGPTLSNAAAFMVKRGFDESCEPLGIVTANFQLASRSGATVADPDTLLGGSTVTIDSREANLNMIPVGPEIETTPYILGLEPNSVQVAGIIQEIPIQKPEASAVELFESCLEQAGKGYPLHITVLNPKSNSESYFTIRDTAGNMYETSLIVTSDLPEDFFEIFWPNHRNNWMSSNFTRTGGPVPEYTDAPSFNIKVNTISSEGMQEFEHNIALRSDDLHEYPMDFSDVLTGKSVPAYPKYWVVQVDMLDGSIS